MATHLLRDIYNPYNTKNEPTQDAESIRFLFSKALNSDDKRLLE